MALAQSDTKNWGLEPSPFALQTDTPCSGVTVEKYMDWLSADQLMNPSKPSTLAATS